MNNAGKCKAESKLQQAKTQRKKEMAQGNREVGQNAARGLSSLARPPSFRRCSSSFHKTFCSRPGTESKLAQDIPSSSSDYKF